MPEVAPSRELSSQETYRPLSALAVAGAILAGASLLIFALPEMPWLLALIPVPAFFVSLVARRRVYRSEGTLAGYQLAGFGMAVSLVIVLGYLTRHFTEYWVVRHESSEFAERWLQKIREGKEGSAFLDTVAPHERRITFNPEDLHRLGPHFPQPSNPNQSLFDAFRRSILMGALFRSRDRFEWKHLGVEWGQGSPEYQIKHRYQLRTPELTGEVQLNVTSQVVTGPSGPRREWRIHASDASFIPGTVTITAYGEELRDAQAEANRALAAWVRHLAEGKRAEAEKMLVTPVSEDLRQEFDQLYTTVRRNLTPAEVAGVRVRDTYLVSDAKEGDTWLLGYRGFIDVGLRELDVRVLVQTDDLKQGPAGWRLAATKFRGERKKIVSEMEGLGGAQMISGPRLQEPPQK